MTTEITDTNSLPTATDTTYCQQRAVFGDKLVFNQNLYAGLFPPQQKLATMSLGDQIEPVISAPPGNAARAKIQDEMTRLTVEINHAMEHDLFIKEVRLITEFIDFSSHCYTQFRYKEPLDQAIALHDHTLKVFRQVSCITTPQKNQFLLASLSLLSQKMTSADTWSETMEERFKLCCRMLRRINCNASVQLQDQIESRIFYEAAEQEFSTGNLQEAAKLYAVSYFRSRELEGRYQSGWKHLVSVMLHETPVANQNREPATQAIVRFFNTMGAETLNNTHGSPFAYKAVCQSYNLFSSVKSDEAD